MMECIPRSTGNMLKNSTTKETGLRIEPIKAQLKNSVTSSNQPTDSTRNIIINGVTATHINSNLHDCLNGSTNVCVNKPSISASQITAMCSSVEIERKKRLAMQKRQQRAQNIT